MSQALSCYGSAGVVRSDLLDMSIYQLFWELSPEIREEEGSLRGLRQCDLFNNCHGTHGTCAFLVKGYWVLCWNESLNFQHF